MTTTSQTYKDNFFKDEAIFKSMPILFPNGLKMERIESVCPQCSNSIMPNYFRGKVLHPIKHVYTFETGSFCESCHFFFVSSMRFRSVDNIVVQEFINKQGVWTSKVVMGERNKKDTPTALWRKLLLNLKTLFKV